MLPLLLALMTACKTDPVDTGSPDADGDGYAADVDCDDDNAEIHPDATEVCDAADNDCDGEIDNGASDAVAWYLDQDGDGYGQASVEMACTQPVGYAAAEGDCDDADSAVHPLAEESDCTDPVDYNCDGSVGYADEDSDGVPACQDCDDSRPEVLPGGAEICDGLDNDCDGELDEDASDAGIWYIDADSDGFGSSAYYVYECEQPAGYVGNAADCDDGSALASPVGTEVCDGLDNDCDGAIDDASAQDLSTWYADSDSDGYGDPSTSTQACDAPTGYLSDGADCDDTDATVNPAGEEVCDGQDNDCDGESDEASATDATTYYIDYDGDGYGATAYTVDACALPSGYSENSDDCDDTEATANPGATEVCDSVDNNCDGDVDEDSASDAVTYYADSDLDGYGDPSVSLTSCTQPSGYIVDDSDCDDTLDTVSPDAEEVCDSVDNNCDGTVDEDTATDANTYYLDSDGDGYGDASSTTQACSVPSGYVEDDSDCDDSDASTGDCTCTLTAISSPTSVSSTSPTYGQWMMDPLETLGVGLVWSMASYTGSTLVEYASLSAFGSQTSTSSTTLPYSYEGTGATVYDGYLYYIQDNSNTIVEYDIAAGAVNSTVAISGAGYHNTYHYQWGGYSDMDLAVDENGLWVIYATSANSGRIVLSSLDTQPLAVVDTWETNSNLKRSTGNAFVICSVLYVTDAYSGGSTTVNYAYDTINETDSNPGISLTQYGYNSMTDYNPGDGLLYSWDNGGQYNYTVSY